MKKFENEGMVPSENNFTGSKENRTEIFMSKSSINNHNLSSSESIVKTVDLSSKSIEINMDYYLFIEDVKNLTVETWRNLADKQDLKDLSNEKDARFRMTDCYLICQSLNLHYIPFIKNISSFQDKINEPHNIEEKNTIVISVMDSLKSYLEPTLNLFETDVKDLQAVNEINLHGFIFTKFGNFNIAGDTIYNTIRKYFEKLYMTVLQFSPKGLTENEKNKKVEILKQINNSYQKIGEKLGIPINENTAVLSLYEKQNLSVGLNNEIYVNTSSAANDLSNNEFNIFNESIKQNESSNWTEDIGAIEQQENNSLDIKDFLTNEHITNAGLTSNKNLNVDLNDNHVDGSTLASIPSLVNSLNTFNDNKREVAESFDRTRDKTEIEQRDANIDNKTGIHIHNLSTTSTEGNLNVIEPASSNIWLAIGLPIIGLMLVVSFAAVYLLKKCKKMKGKARKENEDTQLEEIMPINNS
ncbi:hypothetical protein NBO_354g0002 [Nosema bombycis CQ1]|uniref:Uncharacterized protein n=1 Tax=Nosema bombycis (strain CQ1 / CVCC 102059) TaxID=578461 RepID=R0MJB8_NOSB1|nr:hypothetical protein NBO_354g0002 [Nosema bombycis CQ1]|eukprot:EOB12858.1 hypothetical protein NBO_354g0002 [Nosema bombycis CQ1]